MESAITVAGMGKICQAYHILYQVSPQLHSKLQWTHIWWQPWAGQERQGEEYINETKQLRNEGLTLPKRGLAFALSYGQVISRPLECPACRSAFVCLGTLAIGQSNSVIYDWGFGPHRIRSDLQKGLETKGQPGRQYVIKPQEEFWSKGLGELPLLPRSERLHTPWPGLLPGEHDQELHVWAPSALCPGISSLLILICVLLL